MVDLKKSGKEKYAEDEYKCADNADTAEKLPHVEANISPELITNEDSPAMTGEEKETISTYFKKLDVSFDKSVSLYVLGLFSLIVFIAFVVKVPDSMIGPVFLAGAVIILFIYFNHEEELKKVDVADVSYKKILTVNPDATASFDDGSVGHFISIDFNRNFYNGEYVKVISVNLNKAQINSGISVNTFIFKI